MNNLDAILLLARLNTIEPLINNLLDGIDTNSDIDTLSDDILFSIEKLKEYIENNC